MQCLYVSEFNVDVKKSLMFHYTNADSLFNKLPEFQSMLSILINNKPFLKAGICKHNLVNCFVLNVQQDLQYYKMM